MENLARVAILMGLLLVAVDLRAGELLTCTHPSGGVVYTRTPEVLPSDFRCVGSPKPMQTNASTHSKGRPVSKPRYMSQRCSSTATLKINSSDYSGDFDVELRAGTRPGSEIVTHATLRNGAASEFNNICPGKYFFAFGPASSPEISITRYFDVISDGETYSNPTITVLYMRKNIADDTRRLQTAKKADL